MNTYSFGIEVECFVPSASLNTLKKLIGESLGLMDQGYTHLHEGGYSSWTLHRDGSLTHKSPTNVGVELVSPVFPFNRFSEAVQSIHILMDIVRSVGGFVNRRCGMHIHFGGRTVRELSSEQQRILLTNWLEWQDRFFLLLPSHRQNNSYCKKNSSDSLGERYVALNILPSLKKHGTVEFRLFEGTLNPDKAIARIKLAQLFMKNVNIN